MFGNKRKIISVNSKNRTDAGTNAGDFTVDLNIKPESKYDSVCVLAANIPKSWYLIQDDGSNTFVVEEKKAQRTITLNPGNYQFDVFQSALQTLLNTGQPSGWTYTVTVSDPKIQEDTGKFYFAVSGNGSDQPAFIFPASSAVHEQMGFFPESTNVFSANALTSTRVFNLNRESTIFIRSTMVNTQDSDILIDIFSSSSPDFSTIAWQNTSGELYSKPLKPDCGKSINFRITNEDNKILDMNGADVQITIVLYRAVRTLENIDKYLKILAYEYFQSNQEQNQKALADAEDPRRPPDQIIEEELMPPPMTD